MYQCKGCNEVSKETEMARYACCRCGECKENRDVCKHYLDVKLCPRCKSFEVNRIY